MLNLLKHRCLRLSGARKQPWRNFSVTTRNWTSNKPYYVTTPIFYPNAVPHIGHLYTLVLGDIFSRYQRLLDPDRDVKFLAGTDEHGMKIQQAAARASAGREVDVQSFCNKLSQVFKNLSAHANVSYTTYARTTQEPHKEAVTHVWRTLCDKGYIYKGEYSGWYSITDECFYTSAQVVQSPTSEYVSKETGSKVEWTKEHNYMFRLSAFRNALIEHYSKSQVVTPSQYNAVVLQMLAASETQLDSNTPLLSDISISRPRSRLTWGIPVPGDSEHTIYVWFDALLIYLSGVGYPASSVGWPPNLQIIGKDILRFHALYLPAILMALNAPEYSLMQNQSASEILKNSFPLPQKLLTHAHWTVSQQKMSKSVGNVVDPVEAIDRYGLDIVRFYLARVGGRFRDDVDWSSEQLEKHSKELRSLLGNYFLRITSPQITAVATKGFEGYDNTSPNAMNVELVQATESLPQRVKELMDDLQLSEALSAILDLLKLANKIVTEVAPWAKTCPSAVVYETRKTGLDALRTVGICLRPFVPQTSQRLLDALGLSPQDRTWDSVYTPRSKPGDEWKTREVKSVRLL